MDAFQIEKAVMSVMKTLHAGTAVVKADCATKSRSDYRKELTIMGTFTDYSVMTLCLAGAMEMLKKISDGDDYKTDWPRDDLTVFYANVVRIVVTYDPELEQITLVFTDRRDEVSQAKGVYTEAINRIMSMEA